MTEAWWNDTRIAASDDIVVVEGNSYFPLSAVDPAMLKDSATTSVCPWKGTAHYYTLVAGGAQNRTRRGIIPNPRTRRPRSATASPSGKASKSADPPASASHAGVRVRRLRLAWTRLL